MEELKKLRYEVLNLRNMNEITTNAETKLLHKLNALQEAINYTHCCTELKDKKKLNYEEWKFNQGLRYMSDFTYKNAKGKLFESEDLVKMYEAYKNL